MPPGSRSPGGEDGFAEASRPRSCSMATLSLTNVKKIYDGGVTAVHDFNLEIADKEFIVLVGPSGCGKSTTLRMVAGLEEISEGELRIGDRVVNDVEPKDRDIAMVFQSYALYPHMTVYENMAFALKLRKLPKDEIDRRVREAAAILDISQYLERKPKALSGGQRQRVAIGRAIVREPQVFLMDEPLSNLDAKLRNQMRAEIIKLRQRINTTFIYVTHDQTEAMTLGDRIVIMKDGYIQQVGTPQEVFEHPVNVFVAGFIGTPQMNFFGAQLLQEGDDYYVTCAGSKVDLPAKVQEKLREKNTPAQDIILGIRPEHIDFVRNEDSFGALSGSVDVSEMMGSELHLHVAVSREDSEKAKDVVMRVATSDLPDAYHGGIPYGTQLHFAFPGALVHLFNKDTEENLI